MPSEIPVGKGSQDIEVRIGTVVPESLGYKNGCNGLRKLRGGDMGAGIL